MARLSYYPEGLNDRWHGDQAEAHRLSDCPDTYGRKFGTARAANMAGCAGSASRWGMVMSAWRLPWEMAGWVTQAGNHGPFGKKICRYVPDGGAPSLCRALPSLTPGLVSLQHRLW